MPFFKKIEDWQISYIKAMSVEYYLLSKIKYRSLDDTKLTYDSETVLS